MKNSNNDNNYNDRILQLENHIVELTKLFQEEIGFKRSLDDLQRETGQSIKTMGPIINDLHRSTDFFRTTLGSHETIITKLEVNKN